MSDDGHRVARVDVARRFLPFVNPLVTGAGEIDGRDVSLVSVTDRDGRQGWGEAAPLPGWGVGELSEIESWIAAVQGRLVDVEPDLAAPPLGWVSPASPQVPSAGANAVVSALADLRAQQLDVPLAVLLARLSSAAGPPPDRVGSNVPNAVPVNALIGALDRDASVAAATEAVSQGFRTLKCKVGVGAAGADAERIRAVASAATARAGEPVKVRVDANGAWSPDEAVEFATALDGLVLEWIEDPVPVDQLHEVGLALQPRVATEWRADSRHLSLLESGSVNVVIAKLPLIGGALPAMASAEAVADRGGHVVITTFLGSSIGIHGALHVAAALEAVGLAGSSGGFGVAHGLATASLLAEDLAPAPEIVEGQMLVPSGPGLGAEPLNVDS